MQGKCIGCVVLSIYFKNEDVYRPQIKSLFFAAGTFLWQNFYICAKHFELYQDKKKSPNANKNV